MQCCNIQQEVLVIHGTNDPAVGLAEAKKIQGRVQNAHLEIIPNSGHTFGAVHPAQIGELPVDLEKVVDLCVEFLN